RQHRRDDRQPRRVVALRMVDPRRAGAAHRPRRRGASLERRRAGGLAACLRHQGHRRCALHRPRSRRLPSRPPIPQGAQHVNDRIARLREQNDQPLLVSHPTNVFYLTGFSSSNAMLLVEPERVRLFTDFRYIDAARAVDGVEVTETRRDVIGHLGELISGPIGFEATTLSYAQARRLDNAVSTEGVVERLRAVKEESELDALRRACAITDRMFERLSTEVQFVGRTERDVAWDIARLYHEEGAANPSFESIVGSGPTGSRPHARAGEKKI